MTWNRTADVMSATAGRYGITRAVQVRDCDARAARAHPAVRRGAVLPLHLRSPSRPLPSLPFPPPPLHLLSPVVPSAPPPIRFACGSGLGDGGAALPARWAGERRTRPACPTVAGAGMAALSASSLRRSESRWESCSTTTGLPPAVPLWLHVVVARGPSCRCVCRSVPVETEIVMAVVCYMLHVYVARVCCMLHVLHAARVCCMLHAACCTPHVAGCQWRPRSYSTAGCARVTTPPHGKRRTGG